MVDVSKEVPQQVQLGNPRFLHMGRHSKRLPGLGSTTASGSSAPGDLLQEV